MCADLIGNYKNNRIKSLLGNKMFSEIAASLAVRMYTVVKKAHVICTAYSTDKLTPLLRKCW